MADFHTPSDQGPLDDNDLAESFRNGWDAALASALRGEAPVVSRIGMALPHHEQRRVRWLLRLRWVPYLKANLRAQKRMLRSMDGDS